MTNTRKLGDPERFMTVAEVARELRVSPDTVRRWIHDDVLVAVRLSKRDLRIEREAYEQLVATFRTSTPMAVAK